MNVLKGKLNRLLKVSAVIMVLLVLICHVLLYDGMEIKAESYNYTYGIVFTYTDSSDIADLISLEGYGAITKEEIRNACNNLKISWDNSTKTLRFDGIEFITSYSFALKIKGTPNEPINIVWSGGNVIKSTGSDSGIIIGEDESNTIDVVMGEDSSGNLEVSGSTNGIFSYSDITIKGGTLKISGSGTNGSGLRAANITINGGVIDILEAKGMQLYATGSMNINGGTITAVHSLTRAANANNDGIKSEGELHITGGSISCTTNGLGCGIYGENSVIIGTEHSSDNDAIDITIDRSGNCSTDEWRGGIASGNKLIIHNGTIKVCKASTINYYYNGLTGKDGIVINNGNIDVMGSIYGLYSSEGDIQIVNGTVKAEINGDGSGIHGGKITIGHSSNIDEKSPDITINKSGNSQNDFEGAVRGGLCSRGFIEVNSGLVNISAKDNEDAYYRAGIRSQGGITISNGMINSRGAKYGMFVTGGAAIISGGTVDLQCTDENLWWQYGVYCRSVNLNITGGSIKALGRGKCTRGLLIAEGGSLYISGGTVEAEAIGFQPMGILVDNGTTSITGGIIYPMAKGTDSNERQNGYNPEAIGIKSSSGTIQITGGTINSKSQGYNSYGIWADNGSCRIANASIDIEAIGTNSKGIWLTHGGYSVTNSNLRMVVDGDNSIGLYVDNNNPTNIYSGNIEVEANGNLVKGIYTKGVLNIGESTSSTGPSIIIKGDMQNNYNPDIISSVTYDVCGIYAASTYTMNSGSVIIDIKNSKGAYVNNEVNIVNNYITGILSNDATNGIIVNGGNIDINVDTKQVDNSYCGGDGMFTYGPITIRGGRVISKTNGGVYWVKSGNTSILYHSAGIDAKKELTIEGGEVKAINVNDSNTYDADNDGNSQNDYIGMGLYSDGYINITGGHIVAHGIAQAIKSSKGTATLPYNQDIGNDGKIHILASTVYDYEELTEYEVESHDEYKYIEIGVQYSYYLKYVANAEDDKNMYKISYITEGDNAGTEISTVMTDVDLAALNMSIDRTNNKIICSTAIFNSGAEYALYIEGDATIELGTGTVNRFTANSSKDSSTNKPNGKAIYCTGNLNITGRGELIVSGNLYGINASVDESNNTQLTLNSSDDNYSVKVLEGSKTSYYGINTISYPTIDNNSNSDNAWKKYVYVHIGNVAAYYLKYDASMGKMYQVAANGSKAIELVTNNQIVYGWSIDINKNLILDDFTFTTNVAKGLKIVGSDDAKARVIIKDKCSITSVYSNADGDIENIADDTNDVNAIDNPEIIANNPEDVAIGVNKCSGIESDVDVEFGGSGNLIIESKIGASGVNREFIAINSDKRVAYTSGTYTLIGGVGINATQNVSIDDATMIIKGVSQAIKTGGFDVHAHIKVSTDYRGTSAIQHTTINDVTSDVWTEQNYRYVETQPSVISVDISWGDMNYIGAQTWNPNTHTYEFKIKPSVAGYSEIIRVSNSAESNVPIMAKYIYTQDALYTGISGEVSVSSGYMSDERGYKVDNGNEMTTILELTAQDNTVYDFANQTSVGNVCVILSEY